MGEVAMVTLEERHLLWHHKGNWPAAYFHSQFAIKAEDRDCWFRSRRSAAGDCVTVPEAAEIGSTTFMDFHIGGESATFKVAKVLSLPELFLWGYEKFTGLELYFYYNNCLKVVKKTPPRVGVAGQPRRCASALPGQAGRRQDAALWPLPDSRAAATRQPLAPPVKGEERRRRRVLTEP